MIPDADIKGRRSKFAGRSEHHAFGGALCPQGTLCPHRNFADNAAADKVQPRKSRSSLRVDHLSGVKRRLYGSINRAQQVIMSGFTERQVHYIF